MKPHQTRIRLVSLALALLIAIPALAAGKRRSVKHPAAGAAFTATVKGKVLDLTTGLPVPFAIVSVGDRGTSTSREGEFQISGVTGAGTATVTASRPGYNSSTQTITGGGTHDLTFRIQARPAVTLRLTNGTTIPIADTSVKFGYVILFGGYVSAAEDDFCKPDGTLVTITAAGMKRIVGPSTLTATTACCAPPAQKVRLELRSGETTDATFKDSCDGYTVEFIGMNQNTGDNVYAPFGDVAEVIFP